MSFVICTRLLSYSVTLKLERTKANLGADKYDHMNKRLALLCHVTFYANYFLPIQICNGKAL